MEQIFLSVDHYVEYLDANDSADATELNSGTCTYALYLVTNTAGVEVVTAVSGGTGTCSYVAASDGNYRGVIQSSITSGLTLGAHYRVVITFVQGNYDDVRSLDYRAARRGRN